MIQRIAIFRVRQRLEPEVEARSFAPPPGCDPLRGRRAGVPVRINEDLLDRWIAPYRRDDEE